MNDLESLVQMVRVAGLSTGHAESPEQLMREMLEQVETLRQRIAELETHKALLMKSYTARIATLEAEVKRLREELLTEQMANAVIRDQEVARLREAIEAHRAAHPAGMRALEVNQRLWSVLDDGA